MRVSAEGNAIDTAPPVIPGNHLAAHVASSGDESLITLDSDSGVSTVVAHTGGSTLTLDPEMPLFRWYSKVGSGVAWNGATYTVGWSAPGAAAGPSWLGAAYVTRSGQPIDYRVTPAGPLGVTMSVAVNDAGITAFAVSEAPGPNSIARARLYLASDLGPMPAPPRAPTNVVNYFGSTPLGNTARIDWESDAADGFAIDVSYDSGKTWGLAEVVAGAARTITVYPSLRYQYRIRAFGPGGVSEPTITTIASTPRRRAERR